MNNIIKALKYCSLLLLIGLFFGCSSTNEPPIKSSDIDKTLLLQLVNSYRASGCNCGSEGYFPLTNPLTWNNIIELTAQDHSSDMFKKKFLDHKGSNGSTPGTRLNKRGYNWSTCGENIARGYSTEQAVIEDWIKSPTHCRNIMNPNFKEMGVSKVDKYWTQVFGTK